MVFPKTTRAYDANAANTIRTSTEYAFVLQSPDRMAIKTNTDNSGDATGAMHPFDRAKVYAAYGYGLSGAGVTIGVADVGYNLDASGKPAHQDFSTSGKLTIFPSSGPLQSDAHGMHVSGLAAADKNGVGLMGVAYNAKLLIGQSPTLPTDVKAVYDDYTKAGVSVANNSYGLPVNGTEGSSPWNPIKTSTSGLEVTTKNALAYRDSKGISSAQMMSDIGGGSAADWTAAVASLAAFQAKGGVVVWSNSNYGVNEAATGGKGLDDADLNSSFDYVFPELKPGWITVVNATSKGLAIQTNGADAVAKATKVENNIYLYSAQCGIAAANCLSMDGVSLWSASNKGVTSYESQSGTSQAGPEVAGMIALLREAFPTASSADLAARLLYTADNSFFLTGGVSKLSTATYTNANGTISHTVSDIWGHGFPDLQNALSPVGNSSTQTASGQKVGLQQLVGSVQLSRAFGGAPAMAGASFLFNDVLNGVFVGSLGQTVRAAADPRLLDAVAAHTVDASMATASNGAGLTLRFSSAGGGLRPTDDRYPDVAFTLRQEIGAGESGGSVAVGYGLSADNALGFAPRHAGVRAASPSDTAMGIPYVSFGNRGQTWAATGFQTGDWRWTVAGFASGAVQSQGSRPLLADSVGYTGLQSLRPDGQAGATGGAVADLVWSGLGFLSLNASVGQVTESSSFLGSVASNDALRQGAASRFARVGFFARLTDRIGLQGNYATGMTDLRGGSGGLGLISNVSGLRTEAAGLAFTFDDLVGKASRVTLGASTPLRVAEGRGTLNLAQTVSIDSPGVYRYGFVANGLNLTPGGREVDYTLEYSRRLSTGMSWGFAGSLLSQPGHDAQAPLGAQGLVTLKIAM